MRVFLSLFCFPNLLSYVFTRERYFVEFGVKYTPNHPFYCRKLLWHIPWCHGKMFSDCYVINSSNPARPKVTLLGHPLCSKLMDWAPDQTLACEKRTGWICPTMKTVFGKIFIYNKSVKWQVSYQMDMLNILVFSLREPPTLHSFCLFLLLSI